MLSTNPTALAMLPQFCCHHSIKHDKITADTYEYTLTNRAVSAAAMLSWNGTLISGWMAL